METESAKIDDDPRDKRWTVFWNEFEKFREVEYTKLACKLGIELPRVVVDDDILDKMDDRDLRFYNNSRAFDALLNEMGREKFSEWCEFIENEKKQRAAVLNEIIEKADQENYRKYLAEYNEMKKPTVEEILDIEKINGQENPLDDFDFIDVFPHINPHGCYRYTTAIEWRYDLYRYYLQLSYYRLGYKQWKSEDQNFPYNALKITRPLTFERFLRATKELILNNTLLVHLATRCGGFYLEAFPELRLKYYSPMCEEVYDEFNRLRDDPLERLYGDYEKNYHEWILENESDSTIEDMRTIYDPYVRDIDFDYLRTNK